MPHSDASPPTIISASLEVPSHMRYLRTLRLTTASLLTSWDCDIELVEDLRVAVTEACTLLWDHHGQRGTARVDYHLEGDVVRVELQLKSGPSRGPAGHEAVRTPAMDAIGESLITHLTDKYSYDPAERRISLEVSR